MLIKVIQEIKVDEAVTYTIKNHRESLLKGGARLLGRMLLLLIIELECSDFGLCRSLGFT